MNTFKSIIPAITLILAVIACSFPTPTPAVLPTAVEMIPTPTPSEVPTVQATISATAPPPTELVVITHIISPSSQSASGRVVYDVDSSGTGPEKRAPYGDSYDINRLERPFLKDMTYVPDLDIFSFTVSEDTDWFYVTIKLIGKDPNNSMGIDFGVELDTDHDGFGDYIIVAHPPYTTTWDTANVEIFEDRNHDTAGLSAEKSDAPLTTDGYETQIFHGGAGDSDTDMAWVRMGGGAGDTIEFAFKKSWSGVVFLLGVLSDSGLKDVTKLDYVDRFQEAEAGSPVRDKKYYPLGALYAVDNTCQEAFGFKPTGYEPKLCPRSEPTPGSQAGGCDNPGQYTSQIACEAAGCSWEQVPGVFTHVLMHCTNP